MTRRVPTIGSAALDVIHRRGPLDLDVLVDEVVRAELTRAKDPRRAVATALDRPDVVRDWDGRYCSLVDQLDGAIFSHAPTTLERRNEIVLLDYKTHRLTRAEIPAVRCTTRPPAKSSTPLGASQPPPQTQCATGT